MGSSSQSSQCSSNRHNDDEDEDCDVDVEGMDDDIDVEAVSDEDEVAKHMRVDGGEHEAREEAGKAATEREDRHVAVLPLKQPEEPVDLLAAQSEDQKVLSLAEQFIAAMPDRIKKRESDEPMPLCCGNNPGAPSSASSDAGGGGGGGVPSSGFFHNSQSTDDLGVESMCDDLDLDFNLDDLGGGQHVTYREVSYTPNSSSLSPESSCLQSPVSYAWESPSPCGHVHHGHAHLGHAHSRGVAAIETRSPPGTAADMQEFLQVKCSIVYGTQYYFLVFATVQYSTVAQ